VVENVENGLVIKNDDIGNAWFLASTLEKIREFYF
jgi:hypothetical protein